MLVTTEFATVTVKIVRDKRCYSRSSNDGDDDVRGEGGDRQGMVPAA